MGDASDRLRVPDPDNVGPDGEGPLETLALAGVLTVMFTLLIALLTIESAGDRRSGAGDRTSDRQTTVTSTTPDPPDTPSRDIARRLADLPPSKLDALDWSAPQVDAVMTHGTRDATEAACRAIFDGDALVSPRRARPDFLSLVDRRAEHAPFSCLYRQYFADNLDEHAGLFETLDTLWSSSIQLFQPVELPLSSVVADWHPARHGRPDDPRINPWLRLCALQYTYQAADVCQQVLAGVAPEQGRDLLMTIDTHFANTTPLNPTYDVPILIDGLGRLASSGQPDGWEILETEAMPDYNADIRIGAAWYLCRVVNSPNSSVAEQAAAELTNAAGYSVRMVNASLRKRWLKSCRIAFRTDGSDDDARAPALAVWNGESDTDPDYTIQSAMDRGDCQTDGPEPPWYCAVRQYRASSASDLDDFFVQSRGLETHDSEW
jgi:hypothetical protein